MTVYFGIWKQSFGLFYNPNYSIVGAVFNTMIFTLFWGLMIWSHFEALRTKPGYVPKEKEMLNEELIPKSS